MELKKIKDCFPIIRNGATVKQDKASGGIPITRIESINENKLDLDKLGYAGINDDKLKDFYLEDGDILMSHINSVSHLGKVAVFENRKEKIIHGMNLLCLKADKNIVFPNYAFYYFRSPSFINSLKKITKKSVNQASFNISSLGNLKIPLPEKIEDQHRIATILSKAEALIAQRKQSITLLDDYLKSTFLDMFGDPVRNEKGWEVNKIKNIVKVGTGGTPSRQRESEFYGGDINWAKTTEVNGNNIYSTEEKITELALSESNCKVYPIDTILLAMYGQGKTRGNVGLLKIEAATNQACATIPPSENINQIFLFELLKHSYTFLRSLARGGNQENLNLNIVGNVEIIIPPLPLQNQFAAKVQKVEMLKNQYQQSLVQLQALFGSLSQRGFKGELALDKVVVEEENVKPVLVKNEEKDNSKTEDSLRWELISEYKKKGLSYKEIGNHILDKPNFLFTKEDYFGMLYEKEPFEIVKKQIQFFLDDTAINFKESISKKNIAERIQDAVRIQFYKHTKKHDIDVWLGKKCFKFYSEYILSNKSLDSLLIKKEFSQYTNAYNLFKNEYLNAIKNRIQDFIVADHSTLQNKSTLVELICKKCFYDILEFTNTKDYIDFISLNIKKMFKQFQIINTEDVDFLGAELFFDDRDFTLSHEGVLSVINIEFKQQKYGISFQQIESKFKNVIKDYNFKKLKSLLFDLLEKKEIIQHYASKEWMQSMQNMQYSAHGGAEFVGDGSIWFLVPQNVATK